MEKTTVIKNSLVKMNENFQNETAVAILNSNYDISIIVFSFIYFFTFLFFINFFFKNGTYKFFHYLVLSLLFTAVFFIYISSFTIVGTLTVAIILISLLSQKELFIDLIENIKLQKTESDRLAMVLLFSSSNKTDLENKINNLSMVDLAKEDYKLAFEKLRRNIDKFTNENFTLILVLVFMNLVSLLILIASEYAFIFQSEYFIK